MILVNFFKIFHYSCNLNDSSKILRNIFVVTGSPYTATIFTDPDRIVVSGQSLASSAVGKTSYFKMSNVTGSVEDIEINVEGLTPILYPPDQFSPPIHLSLSFHSLLIFLFMIYFFRLFQIESVYFGVTFLLSVEKGGRTNSIKQIFD